MKPESNKAAVMVGKRVRAARLAAGISQVALAKHCKVTFQQIQKNEKGTNRTPPERLAIIAEVTGKPMMFFLQDLAPDAPKGAGADNLLDTMQTNGGIRLIKAFNKIDSEAVRSSLVKLVEEYVRVGVPA
jgi:transcriptional regulator with XRE-family HTH domain